MAFDIDTNGILTVTARDKDTGKAQEITISGSTQLSRDEIDRMVNDAQGHAEEDRRRHEAVGLTESQDVEPGMSLGRCNASAGLRPCCSARQKAICDRGAQAMRERRYEIVLCRRERDQLTLERLAATAEIHPGLVEQFVAYGLLEPVEWVGPALLFDVTAVLRLRMIMRLRRDTGVNLAGIGMILDLLDGLRALERENQWLRAQQ